MPAIAAATLSKIVVLIGLSPRMSTTECTTITSRVPTSGPNRRFPDAIGVTMILGMPIGRHSIALAPSTAPSAPPSVSTPSKAALAEQIEREPLQPEQHAVHRFTAAPGLAQRSMVLPPSRATSARDTSGTMSSGPARMPESATMVADAERLQAIANVGDLRPLRVERADEEDGLHRADELRATKANWGRVPLPIGNPEKAPTSVGPCGYMCFRSVLTVSSTSHV